MRIIKITLITLISLGLIYLTYQTVNIQNNYWRSSNGNVGFDYWLIRPLIWFKITTFGSFLIKELINKSIPQFKEWKLASIRHRVFSNVIDLVIIGFIWFVLNIIIALLILPLYKLELITPRFKQYSDISTCINVVFDYGGYIFALIFIIYSISLEYFQKSTLGKMFLNIGIISTNYSKPTLTQILIKNIIRFVPINDLWVYFKGYSLNETLSKTRLVVLDKKNQKRYNSITS
jgi:uncharacterized RDD family membrane protein YckC